MQNGPVASVPMSELVTSVLVLGASVSLLAAGMIIGSALTSAFLVGTQTRKCGSDLAGTKAARPCSNQGRALRISLCFSSFHTDRLQLSYRADTAAAWCRSCSASCLRPCLWARWRTLCSECRLAHCCGRLSWRHFSGQVSSSALHCLQSAAMLQAAA